jgi:lipid II:glycine glycyltransferase (peptidoglycan interpeptide bridge formation enzyme)
MRNIFGNNFRIYVAENNGVKVAGILILLYKNTIEYFTPVVETDYKDKQVLSALIFETMITLFKEGYKIWNWGGTWPTQDGVYRFKSRWGAEDKNYNYYNLIMDERILNFDKSLLLKAFPNFYLYKY